MQDEELFKQFSVQLDEEAGRFEDGEFGFDEQILRLFRDSIACDSQRVKLISVGCYYFKKKYVELRKKHKDLCREHELLRASSHSALQELADFNLLRGKIPMK